jgi:hypothetical protein
MHGPAAGRPRRGGGAFTLVEMVMALAITAILLAGMTSALTMVLRPTETGADANAAAVEASAALGQIGAELATAKQITRFDQQAIDFTVADRDGDGVDERITYQWSGVPGDPLTRSYKGSAPGTVLAGVRSLAVASQDRPAAVPVESSTVTFASCDQPAGKSLSTVEINKACVVGQYVRPDLPAGAVSWKITGLRLALAKSGTADSTLLITISSASASLTPTTPTLAFGSFPESALGSSPAWVTIPISTAANLTPGQGVCITISCPNQDDHAGYVSYITGNGPPYNSHYLQADNGTTWKSPNDQDDLRFILTGTYTTLVEP